MTTLLLLSLKQYCCQTGTTQKSFIQQGCTQSSAQEHLLCQVLCSIMLHVSFPGTHIDNHSPGEPCGGLSHCCCGGRDPSSNDEIHASGWFSKAKSQFLYQLLQLSRTSAGNAQKGLMEHGEISSSPVCVHPSLMERERQRGQETEALTPQQKVGWRSSVLCQSQLQTCPFPPSCKAGTWVKMLPFEEVMAMVTELLNAKRENNNYLYFDKCINYQVKKEIWENNLFLRSYCTLVWECEEYRELSVWSYSFKWHKSKEMHASNHRGDTSLHFIWDRTEITKGNHIYSNS